MTRLIGARRPESLWRHRLRFQQDEDAAPVTYKFSRVEFEQALGWIAHGDLSGCDFVENDEVFTPVL